MTEIEKPRDTTPGLGETPQTTGIDNSSPALIINVTVGNPVEKERLDYVAESHILRIRLVDAVTNGKLTTPGLFEYWCSKFWYLTREDKETAWFAISEKIDHDVFREMKGRYRAYSDKLYQELLIRKKQRRVSLCNRR